VSTVAEPTLEALLEDAPPAQDAEEPKASGKDTKASKKDAKSSKKDSAAQAKGEVLSTHGPSIAAHPRAARAVTRAKAWAGLVCFGLGGYLSLPTGTLAGALERALAAGVVGYVAAWAAAVFVWRRLVILEIKAREQQLLAVAQRAHARRDGAPQGSGVQQAGARGGA